LTNDLGHLENDLCGKSLDWYKTPKNKHNYNQKQHKNLDNHAKKTNETKAWGHILDTS